MQLIDIGANLTHSSFDRDREAVLERAAAAGVAQMIVTGANPASSQQAFDLARAHAGRLFATAGIHPHHAAELEQAPDLIEALARLAAQPAVVAVGECGLDYFRDLSPRRAQRLAFERQLELAVRIGKPVFLHQRDAHEDFVAILREHRHALAGAVAHCFTGTREQLLEYLELDLAIGLTGFLCDERRGRHLVPLVREIPADRLMVETDAPYLLPRDLRPKPPGTRNEPMYLPQVAQAVATARGIPLAELADATTRAARMLFHLPEPLYPNP